MRPPIENSSDRLSSSPAVLLPGAGPLTWLQPRVLVFPPKRRAGLHGPTGPPGVFGEGSSAGLSPIGRAAFSSLFHDVFAASLILVLRAPRASG